MDDIKFLEKKLSEVYEVVADLENENRQVKIKIENLLDIYEDLFKAYQKISDKYNLMSPTPLF